MISNQNISTKAKSPFTKDSTSVILSKSIQGSPYKTHEDSIDKSSAQTERKILHTEIIAKLKKGKKNEISLIILH